LDGSTSIQDTHPDQPKKRVRFSKTKTSADLDFKGEVIRFGIAATPVARVIAAS
jgi:hypothetical protein